MAHITFIHGISNKPRKDELHRIWKAALAGASTPLDLSAEGISSEMVYWADVLYESPMPDGAYEADPEPMVAEVEINEAAAMLTVTPNGQSEAQWIAAMEQRLGISEDGIQYGLQPQTAPEGTLSHDLERIPLPGFAKDAFLKHFLRDVHHYLFNTPFSPRPGATFHVQDEIRNRFVSALRRGAKSGGPHIVVSHSMGTVIAYDCLKRVTGCPQIDALVTIGSPLGIDEVQDKLRPEWTRDNGFPGERLLGKWVNYFDRLDVVSRLDPYLANDYRRSANLVVEDIAQNNDGVWRHDIVKYLKGPAVSDGLYRLVSSGS